MLLLYVCCLSQILVVQGRGILPIAATSHAVSEDLPAPVKAGGGEVLSLTTDGAAEEADESVPVLRTRDGWKPAAYDPNLYPSGLPVGHPYPQKDTQSNYKKKTGLGRVYEKVSNAFSQRKTNPAGPVRRTQSRYVPYEESTSESDSDSDSDCDTDSDSEPAPNSVPTSNAHFALRKETSDISSYFEKNFVFNFTDWLEDICLHGEFDPAFADKIPEKYKPKFGNASRDHSKQVAKVQAMMKSMCPDVPAEWYHEPAGVYFVEAAAKLL